MAQQMKTEDGIQEIIKTSFKMSFPFYTIATASLLYNTVTLHSSTQYTPQELAISCLFLATKIDETLRKLKDFTADDLMRKKILFLERIILHQIKFNFTNTHPFKL